MNFKEINHSFIRTDKLNSIFTEVINSKCQAYKLMEFLTEAIFVINMEINWK